MYCSYQLYFKFAAKVQLFSESQAVYSNFLQTLTVALLNFAVSAPKEPRQTVFVWRTQMLFRLSLFHSVSFIWEPQLCVEVRYSHERADLEYKRILWKLKKKGYYLLLYYTSNSWQTSRYLLSEFSEFGQFYQSLKKSSFLVRILPRHPYIIIV